MVDAAPTRDEGASEAMPFVVDAAFEIVARDGLPAPGIPFDVG